MKKKIKKIYEDKSDWLIAAGLFIGLGVGFITGHILGYGLIGFGLGLLATFLLTRKKK
jgi:hypothetical protein